MNLQLIFLIKPLKSLWAYSDHWNCFTGLKQKTLFCVNGRESLQLGAYNDYISIKIQKDLFFFLQISKHLKILNLKKKIFPWQIFFHKQVNSPFNLKMPCFLFMFTSHQQSNLQKDISDCSRLFLKEKCLEVFKILMSKTPQNNIGWLSPHIPSHSHGESIPPLLILFIFISEVKFLCQGLTPLLNFYSR